MLQVRESACVLCHLSANFTDFLSTVPIRDLGWSSEGDEPAVALPPPTTHHRSKVLAMIYRIVSNLTDISNYPDTILNDLFTSNYTGQSTKYEFLLF